MRKQDTDTLKHKKTVCYLHSTLKIVMHTISKGVVNYCRLIRVMSMIFSALTTRIIQLIQVGGWGNCFSVFVLCTWAVRVPEWGASMINLANKDWWWPLSTTKKSGYSAWSLYYKTTLETRKGRSLAAGGLYFQVYSIQNKNNLF